MPKTTELRSPITNRLLAALPAKEYASLFPKLEQIAMNFGENIYERGGAIRHVYFPGGGIISLLAAAEDDATIEVGMIGKEGIAGIALFLGVKTSNNRAIVQGAGKAMRMKTADFLSACENGGLLPRLLRRFTQSMLAQVSQSAICYRFHPIEARLARWLLMMSDRLETSKFRITQEFLSNMLGVRREAVNKYAGRLQQLGLISYSRGNITIVDRAGLKKAVCRCYGIIKAEEKSFPAKQKVKRPAA